MLSYSPEREGGKRLNRNRLVMALKLHQAESGIWTTSLELVLAHAALEV